MRFRGTLDYVYALGRLKDEAIVDPGAPPYLCVEEVLCDSQEEVLDDDGRLVFVDEDGGCFVYIDGVWVPVDVNISVSVSHKVTLE